MNDQTQILLYGANGYSGRLILKEFLRRGIKPTVAGRNEKTICRLASESGCPFRTFGLKDREVIKQNLSDVNTLLNCAGPFIFTAEALMDGCLQTKTNYLDITGEIDVFKEAWRKDSKAKEKGIVILSGVGFDVIPTDCISRLLKEELPEGDNLELAFATMKGRISPGTLKSTLEHLSENSLIRAGELREVKVGSITKLIDFGDFKSQAAAIQWGDVFNAYYSTGIPNIKVFIAVPELMLKFVKASGSIKKLLSVNFIKKFSNLLIKWFVSGPDESERERSRTYIWGKIEDPKGNISEHVYIFPDGYSLTALGAVESTIRVINGLIKTGTKTPSLAFGSSFMDQYVIKKIR